MSSPLSHACRHVGKLLDGIVPKSLARRMVFSGLMFGSLAVMTVVIAMSAILNRHAEVNAAARLGPLMVTIYRDWTERDLEDAPVRLAPADGALSISTTRNLPERTRQNSHSISILPGAGRSFPDIILMLDDGNLRKSLFSGTTEFASLYTVMTDIAVGLARHDRQARVYLKLPGNEWLVFQSDRYWRNRTSETVWALAIITAVIFCSAGYITFTRTIARPYRKIAALTPGEETSLPDPDWYWTREAQSILHAIRMEQDTKNEILEERTRMLAAISHDLRTPATRIQLRADYIEDGELRSKILSDLDSMLSMIRDAIDFLKGSIIQEPMEKLDFPSLLQSICDDYADTGDPVTFIEPHYTKVTTMGTVFGSFVREVELKDVLTGYITGQPTALRRAFSNLIGNAVKYGYQARVEMQVKPKEIIVEIRDKGPGIPEEEQENIFKPFYRIEKSRNRQTGGSGLGLSITQTVVNIHHGRIDLLNLPQGGFLVRVILPRSLEDQ